MHAPTLSHFVPTNADHIPSILRLAPLSADDVVLDVGSGDGSFLQRLVAATGCRGVGVEVSSHLHARALCSCSTEIAVGRLVFLNVPVEKLEQELKCFGQELQREAVLDGITYVYLYLLPGSIATSPPLLKLLDQLLAAGAHVITNTYALPLEVEACRLSTWPPDIDTCEGVTEHISRASAGVPSGNFNLYRRGGALPLRRREASGAAMLAHFQADAAVPGSSSSGSRRRELRRPSGAAVLAQIRADPSYQETERRLASHPFLLAAEAGRLSLAQVREFCNSYYCHQWASVQVWAALAGHAGFWPGRLSDAAVPKPLARDSRTIFFQDFLENEVPAGKLLVEALGKECDEDVLAAHARQRPLSFFVGYGPAAVAAASAALLPTFGTMCGRLARALTRAKHGYGVRPEDPLAKLLCDVCLRFSRKYQRVLDAFAGAVIEEDEGWSSYEELWAPVRQIQEERVLAWWDELAATE